MLFTEPAFLFLFLPVSLVLYSLVPAMWRNALLATLSLVFYGLGEVRFVPWLVMSIGINYVLAIWIERARNGAGARWVLALGIASDLVLLLVFKYGGWLVADVDRAAEWLHLRTIPVPSLALPLGISFFTFHKISYKIDVFRGVTRAQRNPMTLALYILFFPQLIAGPIVRYHDISDQLGHRVITNEDRRYGIQRAVVGLAKKVIVANTAAVVADRIFELPSTQLGAALAWLGIGCYTLQIYFDFSGYSDMAIGLALLFGFRFPENFNFPYSSLSITEFWRRWHISLSRWFRDYLYIPLGGNRVGPLRTYANLMVVFFLCGLWHGASWEFVVWGIFHGCFLVFERFGLERWLERRPRFLRRAYTLAVVVVGWVFFRAGSLGKAVAYLASMAGRQPTDALAGGARYHLDAWTVCVMVLGVLTSFPLSERVRRRLVALSQGGPAEAAVANFGSYAGLCALFLLSVTLLAAATYNPFLYFRF
jgi:alginate O-acetyltransferase complex protein AlgI